MAAARERSERVGLSINSLKSRYAFTQLQKKSQEREWLLERCCSLSREGMVAGRLPPFLTSDKRDDLLVRATLRMMPMPLMSAVASHTFEATSALELYIDHQAASAHGRIMRASAVALHEQSYRLSVPRWFVAISIGEVIDKLTNLRRHIAGGRINRVD